MLNVNPFNVTLNEHVASRESASRATQATGVVPSENVDSDAGVQVTVTGFVPLVTVGAGYVTGWDGPGALPTVTSAGHVI